MLRKDSHLHAVRKLLGIVLIGFGFVMTGAFTAASEDDSDYPELTDIHAMVTAKIPPSGVVFIIHDYSDDSMEWVTPRLLRYVDLLRVRYHHLPLSVISHGDEILALTSAQSRLYPRVHKDIQKLVNDYDVEFHVCGAFAAQNGLTDGDFPPYIDVVPSGPAMIVDYRMLGFELIDLDLTW
jgi:intracellular sulfur oxidation DsrE/DsrF family protein